MPSPVCQPSPQHGERILLITHHRRVATSKHWADEWITKSPPRLLRSLERWDWVAKLPCAAGLSVGLCLRGIRCADVVPVAQAQIAPAKLHSCVEEPAGRENGTESVCAFRFLVDNRDRQGWDGVYFAHDDIAHNAGHRWPFVAMRNFLAANRWPAWPPDGASEESCGCGLVDKERLHPRYYWYVPLQWCLREWLGHEPGSAPLSGAAFRWPTAFMFHVDAETVRRRSVAFYQRMYRVARAGLVLPRRRVPGAIGRLASGGTLTPDETSDGGAPVALQLIDIIHPVLRMLLGLPAATSQTAVDQCI